MLALPGYARGLAGRALYIAPLQGRVAKGGGEAMIYAVAGDSAGNPFAVLTAVVGPAILTNAGSGLALGTSNRPGRVVARELAAIEPSGSDPQSKGHFPGDYDSWAAQLAGLQVRTQLLVKALRVIYGSLGLFATAGLGSVLGSVVT